MEATSRLAYIITIYIVSVFLTKGCNYCNNNIEVSKVDSTNIIFLHHSTGSRIWKGGVPQWFKRYNIERGTSYKIDEQIFPKGSPYGWKNYPYDYWNIWVKHAGDSPFMKEPTLEILTKEYDVIIWKHCFPVSDIIEGVGSADINSEYKTIGNYKLQYLALKKKMQEFPKNKFIIWSGPAQVKDETNEENAKRARAFFEWVKKEWDEIGDNIYLWDFYHLETEGGLYLINNYAAGSKDSHPNSRFSRIVAPLFCQRIVDVIKGRGDSLNMSGM